MLCKKIFQSDEELLLELLESELLLSESELLESELLESELLESELEDELELSFFFELSPVLELFAGGSSEFLIASKFFFNIFVLLDRWTNFLFPVHS